VRRVPCPSNLLTWTSDLGRWSNQVYEIIRLLWTAGALACERAASGIALRSFLSLRSLPPCFFVSFVVNGFPILAIPAITYDFGDQVFAPTPPPVSTPFDPSRPHSTPC